MAILMPAPASAIRGRRDSHAGGHQTTETQRIPTGSPGGREGGRLVRVQQMQGRQERSQNSGEPSGSRAGGCGEGQIALALRCFRWNRGHFRQEDSGLPTLWGETESVFLFSKLSLSVQTCFLNRSKLLFPVRHFLLKLPFPSPPPSPQVAAQG